MEEGTPLRPADELGLHKLCLGGTVRDSRLPPGCAVDGGGRRPCRGNASTVAAKAGCPLGPIALDDGDGAAPPLPR